MALYGVAPPAAGRGAARSAYASREASFLKRWKASVESPYASRSRRIRATISSSARRVSYSDAMYSRIVVTYAPISPPSRQPASPGTSKWSSSPS